MKCGLPLQYKDLKPAQQDLRQPQAPHHAGLFASVPGLRPASGTGKSPQTPLVLQRDLFQVTHPSW